MARRVELTTWDDVITHLVDWAGANPTQEAVRDAKRATMHALRDVSKAFNWSYYYSRGRLNLNAPYSTGTVEYDHTGGSYERVVTLSSGTWPSWAGDGMLLIDNVAYEVYSRKSDTEITLSANSNPGADVAAGESYTLYRDGYPLPSNFQSMGSIVIANNSRFLQLDHPNTFLDRQRIFHGVATPYSYAILGDPNYQNTMQVGFYPPPDAAYQLDFIFKRRPRPLSISSESAGKVSASSGGSTVTGSGTAFTSKMVGSVIRLGDATDVPTAKWGSHPFQEERVVVSVASATSLTVDSAWDDNHALVKYRVSDPFDIDVQTMLSAVLRCSELNMGYARTRQDREILAAAYDRELILAREADSRSFREESVGGTGVFPQRLADMPFLGND